MEIGLKDGMLVVSCAGNVVVAWANVVVSCVVNTLWANIYLTILAICTGNQWRMALRMTCLVVWLESLLLCLLSI